MRTICAWCSTPEKATVIKPEDGTGGKDSHGLCAACAAKFRGGRVTRLSVSLEAAAIPCGNCGRPALTCSCPVLDATALLAKTNA